MHSEINSILRNFNQIIVNKKLKDSFMKGQFCLGPAPSW